MKVVYSIMSLFGFVTLIFIIVVSCMALANKTTPIKELNSWFEKTEVSETVKDDTTTEDKTNTETKPGSAETV